MLIYYISNSFWIAINFSPIIKVLLHLLVGIFLVLWFNRLFNASQVFFIFINFFLKIVMEVPSFTNSINFIVIKFIFSLMQKVYFQS